MHMHFLHCRSSSVKLLWMGGRNLSNVSELLGLQLSWNDASTSMAALPDFCCPLFSFVGRPPSPNCLKWSHTQQSGLRITVWLPLVYSDLVPWIIGSSS